jgi:hypothetical protein
MPLFDTPNNLPLNTPPEDIFSSSSPQKPPASSGTPLPAPPPIPRPPLPPAPPAPGMGRMPPRPPEPEDIFSKTAPLGRDNGMIPRTPNPMAAIAESPALGLGRKLTRLVFFAIGAAIIVGGGYALYIYVVSPMLGNKTPVNANINAPAVNLNLNNNNANVPGNVNANANGNGNLNLNANANVNANGNANLNGNSNANANVNAPGTVLAPQDDPNSTVDSDGDGLTDYQEVHIYHTDPNKADTDNDGLNDREEVITWKTNPLNPDTDGDGYSDGVEVKNGFNPLGPGKLLPPVIPQ